MRKLLTLGIAGLAVAGMAAWGTYNVSAMGNGYGPTNGTGNGSSTALALKAQAVNLTAEQLRTQLQTKTMLQIAQDQGLTLDQYKAKMREAAQARWQAQGLSAAEIATRTAAQAERQANCDGTGAGSGQQMRNGQQSRTD